MISIKKHLDEQESALATQRALHGVIDAILAAICEHAPAADETARRRFSEDLERLAKRLRQQSDASAVLESSQALVRALTEQWTATAGYFSQRDRELAGIITLLAETASRLDTSNKGFYEDLHRTVENLESVSKIDDLSSLRQSLSEHVRHLQGTVARQEVAAEQMMEGIYGGIDAAKTQVQAMSRFVTTEPLTNLPSRRHGEEFLGDLFRGKRPFCLGIVTVARLDLLDRRYGRQQTEAVLANFARQLSDRLTAQVHLYIWARGVFVAFGERMAANELREELSAFLRAVGSKPFSTGERGSPPVTLEPQLLMHEPKPDDDSNQVCRLIDNVCGSPADPGGRS